MQTIRGYAILAFLCITFVGVTGCGEDSPVAGGPPLMDLASFTAGFNGTSSVPPALPLTAHVQFGVASDPPDPSSDYPIPLLFEGSAFTEVGQTVTAVNLHGSEAAITAARLVDGIDEYIYYQLGVDGAGASGTGSIESTGLTYAAGLDRSGPDLAGYVVTAITVEMKELSATQQPDDRWKILVTAVGTIRGHKR
ncbi:MAG TPA: hypothetical protein VFX92_01655 [Candidatus Krumholzibacteria bacterium]|nr:hypothetical protein [Candidatus Krumholzibacteria bacterium]